MSTCPIHISHDLQFAAQALAGEAAVVIDVETSGVKYQTDQIVGVALHAPGQPVGFYLPVYSTVQPQSQLVPMADVIGLVASVLGDPNRTAVFQNGQFDLLFFRRLGISADCRMFDTYYAEHRLDNTYPDVFWQGDRLNYKLKTLTRRFFGQDQTQFDDVTGGLPMQMVQSAVTAPYAVQDVYYTGRHYQRQLQRLQLPANAGIADALFNFDFPMLPVTVDMMCGGIDVDVPLATDRITAYRQAFIHLGQRLDQVLGRPVDLSKRGELILVLKNDLGLPVDQYTSLSAKNLLAIAHEDGNPHALKFVRRVVLRRKLADTISKFLVPLLARTDVATSKLYIGGFHSVTATARFAAQNPNIQALPDAGDSPVRRIVLPGPGRTLVAADFKNIEPRCLAQALLMFIADNGQRLAAVKAAAKARATRLFGDLLAQRQFLQVYKPPASRPYPTQSLLAQFFLTPGTNNDPYSFIASHAFGIPSPTKAERDRMKTIFLGMVYGRGMQSLMDQLKVSFATAAQNLTLFAGVMPELGVPTYSLNGMGYWKKDDPAIVTYKDEVWERLRHSGEVQSLFGRMRRFPGLYHLRRCERCRVITQRGHTEFEWDVAPVQLWNYTLHAYVHQVRNLRTGVVVGTAAGKMPLEMLQDRLTRWPFHQISYRAIRRVEVGQDLVHFMPIEDAQREGFNAVIQATAGDVFKLAILRMRPVMAHFGARMLFNVHDELVFSVPNGALHQFVPAMIDAMCAMPAPWWHMPILVDVEVGHNYGQLVEYTTNYTP